MNGNGNAKPVLMRVQFAATLAGLAGLVACFVAGRSAPHEFCHRFLSAYMFWLGISVGAMGLLLVSHLIHGSWNLLARRTLEAVTWTIPYMAALAGGIAFSLAELYPWADPAQVTAKIQLKQPYLNATFFLERLAAYFVIWIVLTFLARLWARAHERNPSPSSQRRLNALGALGCIVFVLTTSFAAIDLVLSLEPDWSSSMFGARVMISQVISGLAFTVIALYVLTTASGEEKKIDPKHWQDLGNLLLAFSMFWMYVSFSEFLIIWAGNLPDETAFFLRRANSNWLYVGIALALFGFFFPFFVLLFRSVKRRGRSLALLAVWMLFMRWVDVQWLTSPAFEHQPAPNWIDLAAFVGIGGVWIAVFCAALKPWPLLEPYLKFGGAAHDSEHALTEVA